MICTEIRALVQNSILEALSFPVLRPCHHQLPHPFYLSQQTLQQLFHKPRCKHFKTIYHNSALSKWLRSLLHPRDTGVCPASPSSMGSLISEDQKIGTLLTQHRLRNIGLPPALFAMNIRKRVHLYYCNVIGSKLQYVYIRDKKYLLTPHISSYVSRRHVQNQMMRQHTLGCN